MASKGMASAAAELFQNPETIQKARTELKERLGGELYTGFLAKDTKPHPYSLKLKLSGVLLQWKAKKQDPTTY